MPPTKAPCGQRRVLTSTAGPVERVSSSSSVCLSATHPSWRSAAPPLPWRGSWPARRALPERYRCPPRTWDISLCSFSVIVADVPAFVTFAFGGFRVRRVWTPCRHNGCKHSPRRPISNLARRVLPAVGSHYPALRLGTDSLSNRPSSSPQRAKIEGL